MSELRAAGGEAIGLVADLAALEETARLAREARAAAAGPIDILPGT